MKTNLLQQAFAVGVGAVLLFAVQTSSADEPKPKRKARTEKKEAVRSNVATKTADGSGKVPTVSGRHATSAEGRALGGATGYESRVPTGSHIPQTYQRRGYTTDRADDSFIYDQNDVRLRDGLNVSDGLRSVPGVTIRGTR